MKKIKDFIQNYIQNEFDCNKNEFLRSVTDKEYEQKRNKAIQSIHSQFATSFFNRGIEEDNLKYFTEDQMKSFEKNSIDAIPRTLFQIKHYKSPDLGDALKRIVTTEDIYAFYVSYNQKSDNPLDYSKKYYIAQTNEGLKIIYDMTYYADEGGWSHPVDMNTVKVLDEGELIAIEKYQAPEEKTSLAAYKDDWIEMHNFAKDAEDDGNIEKAIKDYENTLKVHPNPQTFFNLGTVYSDIGKRKTAIEYYDKAITLKPDYASAYNNKAFAYYILEEYEIALQNVEKAIFYEPKDGFYQATKAEILFSLNDEEGFFKAFKDCLLLGIDPTILDENIDIKYGDTERYKNIISEVEEELERQKPSFTYRDKTNTSTLVKQYYKCLQDLDENPNIEFIDYLSNFVYEAPSNRFLERKQKLLKEQHNIILSNSDLECFSLTSISVGWRCQLSLGDTVLKGGFVFNGITDALLFPTDYFKGSQSINSNNDISDKLNWFEHLPEGIDDSIRGCFIKQEGNFPPPIAFFNRSWYVKLDFDYYKYLELLFENYGFKGWQYFYIDIVPEMPHLEDVLEDMRVAVKTLPLLFPDKDWSYHKERYQKIIGQHSLLVEVKEFIENFGKEEYISNIRALDSSITKKIYEEKYDIPFGKYFAKGGKTIPYSVDEYLEDGDTLEEIKMWQDAYFERFVFQIIEYKNPTLGEELKEQFPDVKTVYRCLVSNNVKTAKPKLSISDSYTVIKTENGLKIIYRDSFHIDLSKFITPHDGTHLHILNFGEVVSVENCIVPEEEVSLSIFNKNKTTY